MKCRNDVYMRKIGAEKLDKTVEVDFDVQRNLPDCRKISAKKYVSTDATSPSYNMYKVPANQFECMNNRCVNSGTLAIGTGKKAVYRASNGEDWSAGVITFYVTSDVTAAKVTVSDAESNTNAWEYNAVLGAASSDGFKAAIVDLTQTPTVQGDGWTPSEGYAYITIEVTGGADAGLSSIAIFDDMTDFETSSHVKIGCVTSVDGSWDLDVAENACFANTYDTSTTPTFEKTITGSKVTSNYWRLNPLFKRGTATEGFDIVTVERTIQSVNDYGQVILDDMDQNECGFFSAQLVEPCVIGDAELEKLAFPTSVILDEAQYVLVDNGNGETAVMFNSIHAGRKVLISYPKLVDVEEFVLNADNLDEVRTRMSYVKRYTDGKKYRFVFDNVFVTSFPDALTEEEGEFEFTISIQPDANGRYGRAYKIID